MIRFSCQNCGKSFQVEDKFAGRRTKCSKCGQPLEVPAADTAPQTAMAQSPRPVPVVPPARVPDVTSAVHVQSSAPHIQQPASYATPTTAVQVNVSQSKAAHSLGIGSLVLGIVSMLACWLPIVNLPLSGIGLLLGVAGLFIAFTRKGSGIGHSIAGSAICGVSLLLGIVFISALSGLATAVDEASREMSSRAPSARPVNDQSPNSSTPNPVSEEGSPADNLPAAPEWTNAEQALQLGPAQIKIERVATGIVPLKTLFGDDSESKDELLIVWLNITNVTSNKKVDYRGYMGDFSSLAGIRAELTDENGNSYRAITFGAGTKVRDAETSTSIYPGKSIRDAVVFELPIDGAKFLHLELSGQAFAEDGTFRFEIPASMIQRL